MQGNYPRAQLRLPFDADLMRHENGPRYLLGIEAAVDLNEPAIVLGRAARRFRLTMKHGDD